MLSFIVVTSKHLHNLKILPVGCWCLTKSRFKWPTPSLGAFSEEDSNLSKPAWSHQDQGRLCEHCFLFWWSHYTAKPHTNCVVHNSVRDTSRSTFVSETHSSAHTWCVICSHSHLTIRILFSSLLYLPLSRVPIVVLMLIKSSCSTQTPVSWVWRSEHIQSTCSEWQFSLHSIGSVLPF